MKRTFDEWLALVDKQVEAKVGLNYLDLPDCAYYDWYADEVSPKAAATRAIKAA